MVPASAAVRCPLAWLLLVFTANSARAYEITLNDGQMTAPIGGPALKPGEKPAMDLVLINGQRTSAERALQQAKATADALKCPCRLIYHDGTLPVVDDIAIAWDKMFDADVSLNAATDTLIEEIRTAIEEDRDIFIVSYSGGTIITANAAWAVARAYEDLPEKDKRARLRHIHIVTVGSAVFDEDNVLADGWPEGIGSRFDLFDVRDPIAQFAGPADWDDDDDGAHSYLTNYLPHLVPSMLTCSGREVLAGN